MFVSIASSIVYLFVLLNGMFLLTSFQEMSENIYVNFPIS